MSNELAGAGVLTVVTKQLLDLAAPLGRDVVEMLQTRMRPWAVANQLWALERTKEILLARGVRLDEARTVLREVAPWFDGVSAETDARLRDMWAGLLATMLDPSQDSHPVNLTGVLSQLSPHQAHLLLLVDRLANASQRRGADPAELGAMVGLDPGAGKLKASLLHLGAMRLVNLDIDEIAGPGVEQMLTADSMDGIFLSTLGKELLMACSTHPLEPAHAADEAGAPSGE